MILSKKYQKLGIFIDFMNKFYIIKKIFLNFYNEFFQKNFSNIFVIFHDEWELFVYKFCFSSIIGKLCKGLRFYRPIEYTFWTLEDA